MQTVKISLDMPVELHEHLRNEAARRSTMAQSVSVASVIRTYVLNYLEQAKEQNKKG